MGENMIPRGLSKNPRSLESKRRPAWSVLIPGVQIRRQCCRLLIHTTHSKAASTLPTMPDEGEGPMATTPSEEVLSRLDSTTSAPSGSTPRPQSASNVYRPRSAFSFPRAAQPEIVRAYQKDNYYRDLLQGQVQDVVRSLLGSRALFAHADMINFVGSVTYFTLSTLGGAQTLGEEYVNAMMTEGRTGRIVGLKRRFLFIFLHIVSPFLASRGYAALRRRILVSDQIRSQALQRARLRAAAVAPRQQSQSHAQDQAKGQIQASYSDRVVGLLAARLPSLDAINASDGVLAFLSAAHLALFYLGGRYYSAGQRFSRTEYISTIARRPGAKPPSYEVLGFLLGVQLLVKALLRANKWRVQMKKAKEDAVSEEKEVGTKESKAQSEKNIIEIDTSRWSHKTSPPTLITSDSTQRVRSVPLTYADPDALPTAQELNLPAQTSRDQLEAARSASKMRAAELEAISESVLKCTLCMEKREPEKGTSAVTECGHVFCWDCILGWSKEKLECPLCRQSLNPSHLLPVYNF